MSVHRIKKLLTRILDLSWRLPNPRRCKPQLCFNRSVVKAGLEHPDVNIGCAYASNGSGELILATKTDSPSKNAATKTVKPTNSQQPSDMWTVTSDGKTSLSRLPADKRMSTSDELWAALNSYRRSQNLPEFVKSDVLCSIAQKRANELQALGKLDDHVGFSKYAHEQQTYNSMEEIIQGGVIPLSGTHLVEWGWDRSITGHRETLQSREMTDGCAAVVGLFAVADFGAR